MIPYGLILSHFGMTYLKMSSGLLVAGGYGLFLKQRWLLNEIQPKIVIPLERWLDGTPRVTKDLDFIVGLDLIANMACNGQVLGILTAHGFAVSLNPQGQRWQFEKDLGSQRKVIVELHTPSPTPDETRLKTDRIRIKHAPSLGERGLHGRHNPEAIGCDLSPFVFPIGGTKISVPNPISWTVMKLTAAHERWCSAQDNGLDLRERGFSRDQAVKHAQDAYRLVAMITLKERDASLTVIDSIRKIVQFQRAVEIYTGFFIGNDGWANNILQDRWLAEDLAVINQILEQWYSPLEQP